MMSRSVLVWTLMIAAGPWTRAQEETRSLPVFVDGQAQVVEGFKDREQWIWHDLWVQTEFDSDGDGKPDRMHVDVTRPRQTDTEELRVPVIYETSPYFAGTASNAKQYVWDPKQKLGARPPKHKVPPPIPHRSRRGPISRSLVRTWVPRGFAVVHSSSPGTGLSQGCPTVGGDNESLAPKAVIDWLNGRAKGFTSVDGKKEVVAYWCTGKVGMTGTSYNGTLALAAATTGVEGLEVIIPVSANTSYYHYYRSNGLVRHPGGYMGEDIDVLYNFIDSGYPKRRKYCDCRIRDGEMAKGFDRVTGDYNEFWAGRDYLNDLGPLRAATLLAHGLNDWNVMPSHSVRIYEALKNEGVKAQIYLHQAGHGGSPPMEMMNRWFTRYLYGVENGIEKGPHAWIVREGDKRSQPTPCADYPNPDAEPVKLYLWPGGNGIGGLSPVAGEQQGTERLVDDVSLSGAELAKAEGSIHRLLYATPELNEPLHISGTPRLTVGLACTRRAANFSVWLVSLPWEEGAETNANLITRGWSDPQNHSSLTESKPLVPGRLYELSFDLEPDDQIVPAGQRIALMLFSSDRDFTLWPPPGTKITIDLDASVLELPVVGAGAALESAITTR